MGISTREWLEISDLIAEIHSVETEEELSDVVVNVAPGVIDVDVISWVEHRGDLMMTSLVGSKDYVPVLEKYGADLMHYLPSHPLFQPLIKDVRSGRTQPARGTHDHLTDAKVKETAIFCEVYSKIEIGEQRNYHIYVESDFCILVTAGTRRRFTEASRFKFQILQDHIGTAARRVLFHSCLNRGLAKCGNGVRLSYLSKRERAILPFVLHGKSNVEIAIIEGISPRTIEKQVASILEKTGIENRKMLIAQFSLV